MEICLKASGKNSVKTGQLKSVQCSMRIMKKLEKLI